MHFHIYPLSHVTHTDDLNQQIYLYTQHLADRGQRHMEKKNISFTSDGGMRVGVKELRTEEYSDRTQNVLVKAWNLSEWPNYKSRFWNKQAQAQDQDQGKGASSSRASASASAARQR